METFNQDHKETKIKNINQGTYFRLKPLDTEKLMKGSQTVYINFTF